jgi:sterol desaturase/sphingolipid hydroxylase (fatty acid hydroxylase superfamily)
MLDLLTSVGSVPARLWVLWTSPDRLSTVALVVGVFAAVIAAHLRGGRPLSSWLTRATFTDAAYMLFYLGGFFSVVSAPLQLGLRRVVLAVAPFLALGLIEHPGVPAKALLTLLAIDGTGYWIHRWMHHSPGLWAFHAIHHTQRQLTVLTNFRAHPVDALFQSALLLPVWLVLGTSPTTWALSLAYMVVAVLAHSGLGWSYGTFGWLVVSPRHHRLHHSADPTHHHGNFGMTLSLWDHLFGTTRVAAGPPAAYGIAGDTPPESLLAHLVAPFRRLTGVSRAATLPGA